MILSNSLSEILPISRYVTAVLMTGCSSSFRNCTHCTAESALWSNCPGRYSTEKQRDSAGISIVSIYRSSTGGSENTHVHAFSNTASDKFSTS